MGNFFTCCDQRRSDDPGFGRVELTEARPRNELVDARLVALNDPSVKLGQDPRVLR